MTNETMRERLEDNITVMLYGLPQEWNKVEKEYGPHDADYGVLGLKGKEIAAYVIKEISQALEKDREEIKQVIKENIEYIRKKWHESKDPVMRDICREQSIGLLESIEIINAIKNK